MIMPVVQKPHWKAWCLRKACCTGIEVAVLRQAFDGRDLFVFDVAREREAGADGFAVDQDRAGAADADAAAFNRAFEFQIVAQKFQESLVGIDLNVLRVGR